MSGSSECTIVKAAFPSIDFGSDCCQYDANDAYITCRNGRIVKLSVAFLSLSGAIPSQIFQLTALELLTMNGNKFTGTFPTGVASLPNLYELDLSENKLSGTIPDIFGGNTKFKTFDVSDNSFTGPLPASLGSSSGMQVMYLMGNPLYGSVPSSYGNFQKLNVFHIERTCIVPSNLPGTIGGAGDLATGQALSQCAAVSASLAAAAQQTTAPPPQNQGTTQPPAATTANPPAPGAGTTAGSSGNGGGSGTASSTASGGTSSGTTIGAPPQPGGLGGGSPGNTNSNDPGSNGLTGAGSGGNGSSGNPSATFGGISTATVAAIGAAIAAFVIAMVVFGIVVARRRRQLQEQVDKVVVSAFGSHGAVFQKDAGGGDTVGSSSVAATSEFAAAGPAFYRHQDPTFAPLSAYGAGGASPADASPMASSSSVVIPVLAAVPYDGKSGPYSPGPSSPPPPPLSPFRANTLGGDAGLPPYAPVVWMQGDPQRTFTRPAWETEAAAVAVAVPEPSKKLPVALERFNSSKNG
ncbi:hypothetical protein DFJ73DRAFT_801886 [Zopfochytrium polystomum]|nr:hypothetical protein DFJ73DRAFT_801886 [Zopfochytrium polystomum]